MKGLIEEGNEAVQEEDQGSLRDLAIIAAEQLDLNDAAELLQQTEDEEKEADSKLTQVPMTLYESTEEEMASASSAPKTRRASR